MNDETRYYLRDLLVLGLNILLSVILAETFQFSDQNSISDDIGFLDRIVVYIFFFIPLFSLSLLISYFYRNKRNLETGRLKSSIRYRLTLSFIFVALLPLLPILFLSSNVTGKLYERFYGIDIEEALLSGETLILNEEKPKKKLLVEKTRLLESFLRIQPLNLESLVAGASKLNLIQSDEFYVGIYENEKPILENRVLKYKPLEKNFKSFSKNSSWREFSSYRPDYCMYFIRVPFPVGNYNLQTGIRIHKEKERNVYSVISTRRNYDRADLTKEKLPYRIRLTFSIITVSIFLLAIYFSLLFARKISRPIIELANATQKISMGDTDINLEIREAGEIGALIDSFNQMVKDLKSKDEELMQSQRIAAWKEVAQRMAHEIKNPLTPIQLSAERIRRKMKSENKEQFYEIVSTGTDTIIKQVRVLEHLVNEFSDFARMPTPKLINQNLEPIILEAVKLFEHTPQIKITTSISKGFPQLFLDQKVILRILTNLIKNSMEAIERKREKEELSDYMGLILISASMTRKIMRRVAVVSIEDNGIGISAELKQKVFEPYYSTKNSNTSGIGLAIVQKSVIDHNGHISVDSSRMGGCRFQIELPVS
ncbi:LIC_11548 family sensor histidine kinase [Leptospira borgpetersenii]|uniref:histidine kinase n=1 Tax=Leptospira borgpetersenii serovar Hardjo-bovis (strain JB197) TaxID=355277 RepID=Q04SV4_LEPBJ|nr:ATP-binding protein [Leptospira borgpetersenii]ABJ76016.1 Sensor histidine kinase of a two component response regulator [Leptospira borgpetersenii serovar Hardjo-bovis str. JB197]AMX71183.1 histidine kinase [Leptospira borgpetersenii serovar Hardjo]MBE8362890.1 HAMP domain-containing protein [Leptospira borgpetersenii serovar Balcanica]MBE8368663.1 HAMP domain-containing protein [Leptospira borgpetersenii serovar Balcanica]MBE8401392.1 HAMP domain-containing protein [Leptospira borgpetersen